MHELLVLIYFGGITGTIVYITSCRHKERMELIKHGEYHRLNLVNMSSKTGSAALFLGLLWTGIGIALMISSVFSQDVDRNMFTVSILVIIASASVLLYWKITVKDSEELRRIYEEQGRLISTNKKTD